MNVLYLTMNPNRASTTVPTEGWFQHLRPQGLCPVVVSHETGSFHEWLVQQDIPAYQVALPFPNKCWPWPFFLSLWRLRRIVRRHAIQLIHCNEQDIYPIGQYLARLCRLPIVVSVHFTMGRGYCEWAFRNGRQPQRIFFLSRGSREVCRPGVQGIIPEESWRVLPNGLDLTRYRPDPALRDEFRSRHGLGSELVVGVACALRPRKQLEHLFDAVSRLANRDVRVMLAGGPVKGDEEYVEELLRRAKATLGDRLVHVGHLNDLRGFYNALDLFVNTSQEEICSISVIEALACGCPVVGYASKSVDEQILPGGGEIVEQDRIDLLANALERWLGDPDKIAEGRALARLRAEDAFDIATLSERLWCEYHSVLKDASSRRSA